MSRTGSEYFRTLSGQKKFGNGIIGVMMYRLMNRSRSEGASVQLVLTQKMQNFNARYPAVISITAVLKCDTPLSNAVLGDELEIEFENRQIERIGGLPAVEILEFEQPFTIDFNFLAFDPAHYDALEAEVIE